MSVSIASLPFPLCVMCVVHVWLLTIPSPTSSFSPLRFSKREITRHRAKIHWGVHSLVPCCMCVYTLWSKMQRSLPSIAVLPRNTASPIDCWSFSLFAMLCWLHTINYSFHLYKSAVLLNDTYLCTASNIIIIIVKSLSVVRICVTCVWCHSVYPHQYSPPIRHSI